MMLRGPFSLSLEALLILTSINKLNDGKDHCLCSANMSSWKLNRPHDQIMSFSDRTFLFRDVA